MLNCYVCTVSVCGVSCSALCFCIHGGSLHCWDWRGSDPVGVSPVVSLELNRIGSGGTSGQVWNFCVSRCVSSSRLGIVAWGAVWRGMGRCRKMNEEVCIWYMESTSYWVKLQGRQTVLVAVGSDRKQCVFQWACVCVCLSETETQTERIKQRALTLTSWLNLAESMSLGDRCEHLQVQDDSSYWHRHILVLLSFCGFPSTYYSTLIIIITSEIKRKG